MLRLLEVVLVVGWILVPAIQYVGAFVRTAALMSGDLPAGICRADLGPVYAILLAGTACRAGLIWLRRSSATRSSA